MEIYPLKINEQLKNQFGAEHYKNAKASFNEGKLEEFTEDLFKNPLTNSVYDTVTDEQIQSSTQRFSAIFEWLRYRQVYVFDEDLWKLLQGIEKLEIQAAVLASLPFNVFWIDHDFENGLKGCMVSYGNEITEHIKLTFFAEDNISYICLPLTADIEGKTIEDVINERADNVPDWYISNLRTALNVIIYLCTEKPDVVVKKKDMPSQSHSKTTRKTIKKKQMGIGKVGTNLGRIIRESNIRYVSDGKQPSEHTGKTKSPHLRKAHYHSFWIGKEGEKKLIVKFLSPMFIHGQDTKSEVITTVRKKKLK